MSLARDASRVSDDLELDDVAVAPESSLPSSSAAVKRQLEEPEDDVSDIRGRGSVDVTGSDVLDDSG